MNMESTNEITQVLIDLLKINKDRVEGYKKASYNTSLADLKGVFCSMADESRKNVTDLTKEIIHINPSVKEIVNAGKIYKAWMDMKAKFDGSSITTENLLNCEFAEEAVLDAYKIAKDNSFSQHLVELIGRQEESLKTSHEVIRSYRQSYAKG
jgi:uncharacterized protein (TIGR02284 family)